MKHSPRIWTNNWVVLLLIISSKASEIQTLATEGLSPPSFTSSEDAIMQQELEWAEQAMENYKRKTGKLPIRSSIRAVHVHTEAWRQDSIDVVQGRTSGRQWDMDDIPNMSRKLRGQTS